MFGTLKQQSEAGTLLNPFGSPNKTPPLKECLACQFVCEPCISVCTNCGKVFC